MLILAPLSVTSLKLEAVKNNETKQLEASWKIPENGLFNGFEVCLKLNAVFL